MPELSATPNYRPPRHLTLVHALAITLGSMDSHSSASGMRVLLAANKTSVCNATSKVLRSIGYAGEDAAALVPRAAAPAACETQAIAVRNPKFTN